jgi:toxin YhaV
MNGEGEEGTLRTCERADDAWRVFRRMLDSRHPPLDWGRLPTEAGAESHRLGRLASRGARAGP